jgi:hypothetical protein
MAEPATTTEQDKAQPGLRGSFNAYASPETREKMGWLADKAAEWSGRDVVLVSKNDLLKHTTAQSIETPGGQLKDAIQAVIPQSRMDNLLSWQLFVPDANRASMNEMALEQSPFAALLAAPSANDIGVCIIALPDLDDTKAFLGEAFAGKETDTKRLPGDNEDWLAVVVAHEATHCKMHTDGFDASVKGEQTPLKTQFQRLHDHTLKQEIQADQRGFELYKDAVKEGKPLDPAVLQSFKALRAIDSLKGGGSVLLGSAGNDHTSNLLLETGHHDHDGHTHLKAEDPKAITAITTAQNETAMMAQMAIGMTFGRVHVATQDEQRLILAHEGLAAMIADWTDDAPAVTLRDFDTNPQRASLLSGYALAKDKPELMYAATRALQERGAFGQGTLQDTYARQYIDAIDATTKNPSDPQRSALVTFFHDNLEQSDGGAKTIEAAVRHNLATAKAPDSPILSQSGMANADMDDKNRPGLSGQGKGPSL